uniref:Plasmolipin n=3 Tax=Corvus TaxID=30420 RepID=A0A8C3E1Y4_CORMO
MSPVGTEQDTAAQKARGGPGCSRQSIARMRGAGAGTAGAALCRQYPGTGHTGTHRECSAAPGAGSAARPGVAGRGQPRGSARPPRTHPRPARGGAVPGPVRGMAGLPGARSASPGSPPALDGSFLLSPLGGLMGAQAVLGLLVWSLIAATTYHLHAAYGWVMFVSLFFWILTLLFFVTYLLQLHQKFYMIPWPLVLMIYNAVATVLYITAFVTCAAAVQPTSWRQWDYNRRAAASFFACVTMITYGVSTFLSFRAWKGLGSNAATSQVTDHA